MKKIIEWGIYLLIFLLPWQTRWIFDAGNFNGQRSEYLTRSLYGTDILLISLLILAIIFTYNSSLTKLLKPCHSRVGVNPGFNAGLDSLFQGNDAKRIFFVIFAFFLLLINFFIAENRMLAFAGEAKILLAFGLFWLVIKFAKPGKVALTFVFSLFAPAVLALWQFFAQTTFANKWLGLSAHPAQMGGTSVVETFSSGIINGRWLRAYGSFDHPNILGSVLAVGILVVVILLLKENKPDKPCHSRVGSDPGFSASVKTKTINKFSLFIKKYCSHLYLNFASILFSAGLFVSLSRGAWLALLLGEIALGGALFFQKKFATLKIWLCSVLIMLASFFVMLVGYHDLVAIRTEGDARLEKMSLDQRATYFQQAKSLLRQNFLTGVGIGNYVPALMKANSNEPVWTYQPVHNVFLLIWVEMGLSGLLLAIFLFGKLFWDFIRRKKIASFALLLTLLPALLLDHWLWSFHYGILFFALTIAIAVGFSGEKRV